MNHVPQRARAVIIAGTVLDADGLGSGDLHMVDVAPVPQGLEHRVGQTEDEDVLHRLFAEVVIDAEDLVLGEYGVDRAVQVTGAVEVMTEGLLHDDAHPAGITLSVAVKSGSAKLFDNRQVYLGWHRTVETAVAGGAAFGVDLLQAGAQTLVKARVARVAAEVVEAGQETVDLVATGADKLLQRVPHASPEVVDTHL